jgi:hypothetical protein
MNNSNSFVMQDQVGDVVKSLMGEDRGVPFFRFLGQVSIIAVSIITFLSF